MNRFRTLGCTALLGLALCPAAAWSQATFYGWQLAGGWPVARMTASSDWSSDLGADYRYGASANGGVVEWSGQGRNWSSRAYATNDSSLTVGWEGAARGGAVGETFSGGELRIGPSLVLTGNAVATLNIHLWSELGANEPGYGISSDSQYGGYAAVFLGPQPLDLHWRLDWHSATTGNALTAAWLYFAGAFNQTLASGSGTASGSWAYAGSPSGMLTVPDVILSSSAWDNAGDPRSGRIDTWVTVSLSTEPIAAPVPEPTVWAMMLGGLSLLAWAGRRRPPSSAAAELQQIRPMRRWRRHSSSRHPGP